MIYYSIYQLFFLKNCRGANFKGRGACVVRPLSWPTNSVVYIYIARLCAASVERRASSIIAITADWLSHSVSQSVINSRRDQSTPVVAEFGRSLAAGRYVAVANKSINIITQSSPCCSLECRGPVQHNSPK